MSTKKRKLEITLPANVDAETLEAVINGTGVKLVITSNDPKLNGQPIEIVASDATIESEPHFGLIYQGTPTNDFSKSVPILKKKKKYRNTEYRPTHEDYEIKHGDLIVTIPEEYWPTGLKTSTHQLLDAVMVRLAATGITTPEVVIPHKEYVKMRGITSWASAQRRAQADVTMLIHTSITRKSSSKKPGQSFKVLNFFEKGEVTKKGDVKVTFTQTFFSMLSDPHTFHIMPYPKLLLRLNNKSNPNSYYLLRKIAELKNLNIGKSNEDIISTRVLLENAPYIPSEAEVMEGNRNLVDRIINPFERDMDALHEELSWEYCHHSGAPLSDEECRNFSYKTFKSLLVKISWKNYPPRALKNAKK